MLLNSPPLLGGCFSGAQLHIVCFFLRITIVSTRHIGMNGSHRLTFGGLTGSRGVCVSHVNSFEPDSEF